MLLVPSITSYYIQYSSYKVTNSSRFILNFKKHYNIIFMGIQVSIMFHSIFNTNVSSSKNSTKSISSQECHRKYSYSLYYNNIKDYKFHKNTILNLCRSSSIFMLFYLQSLLTSQTSSNAHALGILFSVPSSIPQNHTRLLFK